jgi:hypothetical protein
MTREQFVSDLSHWNSHLPLLWHALENTTGDVIELGVGDGSTKKLHDYCQEKGRKLYSYDSNLDWFRKFEHLRNGDHHLECVHGNWEVMLEKHRQHVGLLFSDEAPGEYRKFNISMFCNLADVVVAHDAELSSDGGYKYSLVKPLFKHHFMHEFPGASTAAMSNFIDVSKWKV